MNIKQCWKNGYKLKKIAEVLEITEKEALELFTKTLNENFFGNEYASRMPNS
jgi:hypothetical protein